MKCNCVFLSVHLVSFLFWNKLTNLASNLKEETEGKEGAEKPELSQKVEVTRLITKPVKFLTV